MATESELGYLSLLDFLLCPHGTVSAPGDMSTDEAQELAGAELCRASFRFYWTDFDCRWAGATLP